MTPIKKRKIKKRYITLGVIVLLLGIRISLPYFTTNYVNKVLGDLDGYSGTIDDVDIHLYRGAYKICGLRLDKTGNNIKEPFVAIPSIDLSVEWKSLFKGALVAEVVVNDPTITFGFGEEEGKRQTGEEVDWVQIVKDLLPISINRFVMMNGDVRLHNISDSPDLRVALTDLDLEILNIKNVSQKEVALPSPITFRGNSSLGGTIQLNAKADLLKTFPDFDYDAKLEQMNIKKFNGIIEEVAGVTVEKGTLNLYSEMKARDQKLDGYLKPLMYDVQVFSWKEKDRSVWSAIKELFVEGSQELVENRRNSEELTATRIPINGSIEKTDVNAYRSVINLLINAYIDRFEELIDGTIDWQSGDGEKFAYKEEKKKN